MMLLHQKQNKCSSKKKKIQNFSMWLCWGLWWRWFLRKLSIFWVSFYCVVSGAGVKVSELLSLVALHECSRPGLETLVWWKVFLPKAGVEEWDLESPFQPKPLLVIL